MDLHPRLAPQMTEARRKDGCEKKTKRSGELERWLRVVSSGREVPVLRFAPFILYLALLLPLSVSTPVRAQDATPVSASPVAVGGDFAGLVDIGGGRRLFLECRGEGSLTVMLEAGYRSPATVWSDDLVQPEMPRTMAFQGVAAFTRFCMYERPGVAALLDDDLHPSRSDAIPQPRTADSVVTDLHALLRVAGVPGPYILVGHSLGGMFVRLYAATYPSEVAGLVLVDAWYEGLQDQLTPAQWAAYVRLNSEVPPELAGYHDYETLDFAAASAVMRGAAATRPLALMPLAVLSKGQTFGIPAEALGFDPDALDRAWARAQEQLATLVPGARYVVATESAHYVQLQQPELVIDAIRQVVTAARDPASWSLAPTGNVTDRASGEIIYDLQGGKRVLAASTTLHLDTCAQKEE